MAEQGAIPFGDARVDLPPNHSGLVDLSSAVVPTFGAEATHVSPEALRRIQNLRMPACMIYEGSAESEGLDLKALDSAAPAADQAGQAKTEFRITWPNGEVEGL